MSAINWARLGIPMALSEGLPHQEIGWGSGHAVVSLSEKGKTRLLCSHLLDGVAWHIGEQVQRETDSGDCLSHNAQHIQTHVAAAGTLGLSGCAQSCRGLLSCPGLLSCVSEYKRLGAFPASSSQRHVIPQRPGAHIRCVPNPDRAGLESEA